MLTSFGSAAFLDISRDCFQDRRWPVQWLKHTGWLLFVLFATKSILQSRKVIWHLLWLPRKENLEAFANENTCADVMVDALHRNGGVGYSTTLGIPHNTSDTTMHLQAISMEYLWIPNRLENHILWCDFSKFQLWCCFRFPNRSDFLQLSWPERRQTSNDGMMLYFLSGD